MSMTDPIADMLTRIRNANMVGKESVNIPSSRIKIDIAEVFKREGFICDFKKISDEKQGVLRVYLKYGPLKRKVINSIKRESRPGKRVYKKVEDVASVLSGIGMAVYSTSNGILSNRECREKNIGGELICTVW
ncbi:MAG: 30S ribosomal protein S8 [Candidatus Scalindua sp. AMX11]|nr:MAG: 30S ribosomal protein S8 [Candidatus Scalindua sp.]NOG85501.1 30S ribosomal protein S8 [Planctomycetota bacterium]RZV90250.1 MAG: 30S ribosomal protein S8 [Candidatus Scalindua sp. SCAELEC01]TDE64661.1 MAG: 30S ribosomal protein S8 [Candidatus Scalindua sp. AMX11]GJQ57502.1 MAG: 30S ribosomal protein S8 [Candidatus Scalindua sp.]